MANPVYVDTSRLQYFLWQAYLVKTTPNPQVASGAYRPPQWGNEKPQTFIEDELGILWYFDAVIRLDHNQSQRITQHPVQNGANITDHSFAMPATLSLEIGMSEVMDSYVPGQWNGDNESWPKSKMAYQQLVSWKNLGVPLTISSRLDTYENMVIATINAPDDIKTKYGLKAMVTFQQIFVFNVGVQKTSLRPSVAKPVEKGPIKTTPVVTPNITNTRSELLEKITEFFM